MAKTLTIDDETARRIYPSAPDELKVILEENYSKAFFSQDITERIKTFEDACEYNNTNPKARRFVVGTSNQIYQERVAEIVKALNQGWEPNYNNSSEYKYTPWFYLDSPCFRFNGSGFARTCALTGAGSRFAFKSRALADYAGKQFVKEYELWMMPVNAAESAKAPKTAYIGTAGFTGDIKARVKTFEDACALVGEDPEDYKFSDGEPDEIAYRKLKVIAKALNNGWFPDWNNDGQLKWYPWFYLNSPGFRFCGSSFASTDASTGSGSRLRFASEELATYAGKQFIDLFRDYMTL